MEACEGLAAAEEEAVGDGDAEEEGALPPPVMLVMVTRPFTPFKVTS